MKSINDKFDNAKVHDIFENDEGFCELVFKKTPQILQQSPRGQGGIYSTIILNFM